MGQITVGDVAGYRRSRAMSPALTRGETERLLDDLEVLIVERDHALAALERLTPAFGVVRSALNELHHTLQRSNADVSNRRS